MMRMDGVRTRFRRSRRDQGFTIVELLVVIGIIATLMSLAMPAMRSVRQHSRAAECLSNLRQIAVAHQLYVNVSRDMLVSAGLPHGSIGRLQDSWLSALPRAYHDNTLGLRSPADRSPYWSVNDGGEWDGLTLDEAIAELRHDPDALIPNQQISRWSSYGMNIMVTDLYSHLESMPSGQTREMRWNRLSRIPNPRNTVQFLMMTEGWRHADSDASFARSDHVHSENWVYAPPPVQEQMPQLAVRQMEIGAHGGPVVSWRSLANYSFLDGHVRTLTFEQVYESSERNAFFPPAAR